MQRRKTKDYDEYEVYGHSSTKKLNKSSKEGPRSKKKMRDDSDDY